MPNLAYSLKEDEVVTREMTPEELAAAREEGLKHMRHLSFRSCWQCNPSHRRFLEDTTDNFLFRCFACGNIYFNGMDLTEQDYAKPS